MNEEFRRTCDALTEEVVDGNERAVVGGHTGSVVFRVAVIALVFLGTFGTASANPLKWVDGWGAIVPDAVRVYLKLLPVALGIGWFLAGVLVAVECGGSWRRVPSSPPMVLMVGTLAVTVGFLVAYRALELPYSAELGSRVCPVFVSVGWFTLGNASVMLRCGLWRPITRSLVTALAVGVLVVITAYCAFQTMKWDAGIHVDPSVVNPRR